MVESMLYHGTDRQRGERLLKNKRMEVSQGDRHWLGDGSYFFEEDFYSYKWIYDMFEKRFKRKPNDEKELEQFYGILLGKMKVDKKRIFDLDKMEHKVEFDRVYDNCRNFLQYSKRIEGVEFPEGAVINIMFEKMGYGRNYDIVRGNFGIREERYAKVKMRFNSLPQLQICFKNVSCIEPLEFFDYSGNIGKYKILISEYYRDILPLVPYTTKNRSLYKQ